MDFPIRYQRPTHYLDPTLLEQGHSQTISKWSYQFATGSLRCLPLWFVTNTRRRGATKLQVSLGDGWTDNQWGLTERALVISETVPHEAIEMVALRNPRFVHVPKSNVEASRRVNMDL